MDARYRIITGDFLVHDTEGLQELLYHFKNQFLWGKRNQYEVGTSSIIFLSCDIKVYFKTKIRVFLGLPSFYPVLILQKAATACMESLKIAVLHLDL